MVPPRSVDLINPEGSDKVKQWFARILQGFKIFHSKFLEFYGEFTCAFRLTVAHAGYDSDFDTDVRQLLARVL
jgi:hypothetical protein